MEGSEKIVDSLSRIASRVEKAINDSLLCSNSADIVEMGADGTPTQAVDRCANQAVLDSVEDIGLDINILSEETGFTDRGSDLTMVVDPLDGTYNALRGSGPYAISMGIGIKDTNGMEVGLVRDVLTGLEYTAVRGQGAKRNGEHIRVSPFDLEDNVFSVYLGTMATDRGVKFAKTSRKHRYLGCVALEMCLVASGSLDLYFVETRAGMHNPRVFDIAAGTLIVREAGGYVLDAEYRELNIPLEIMAKSSLLALGDRKSLEVLT